MSLAALLFAQLPESSETTDSLRLLDLPEPWLVVLVVVPLFAGLAWIGYMRESLSPAARLVLAALRFSALVILFLVLCRPVRVERREDVHPAEVVVLLDDSASMRRQDAYAGDDAARKALQSLAGRPPSELSRAALVRSAVSKELLAPVRARGYDVRLFRFSDVLEPIESADELAGRGHATHLGDAVASALAGSRGRHVTDVVAISDGRSNGGLPVLDAARSAAAAGIPVHSVVVGDTRPEKNAIVELVEVPGSALEGDEIEVTVRVSGRGTAGVGRAQVLLEELDADAQGAASGRAPRVVADEEVELTEAGERSVLLAPPAMVGSRTGERRFRVSVAPLAGETLTDDNAIEFSVHVSPQKVRVLYVDGYPRWEYRYLKNLLLRSDANFQVQCYLLSATPDFPQESSAGLPPLRALPTDRRELLDNYDVVILGDVPYAISPDPDEAKQFHASLREFVESGGGLLFQAGEFDNPRAYKNTPLEDLLPVVLPSAPLRSSDVDTTRETRPVLVDPHTPHEIVRLANEPKLNRRLWEDEDGLRGFYWYYPVAREKPGSQVLLQHPSATNSRSEPRPLLVTGYYPSGRTLFLAIDATWMWRYHYGDRYHERFWRNAIRWLALGRLKSGDRRYRIETPRSGFNLDERVTLEARVLDEDFKPSEQPAQEVVLAGPDGRTETVQLPAVPSRPGLYRTGLEVERTGLYRAWIEVGGERASSTEFEVVLPSRENADPSPDPRALASLSSLTGGRAVDLAHLRALLEELPGNEERREPISSKLQDAWDRWLTILVALGVLSAEWILRKRWELV